MRLFIAIQFEEDILQALAKLQSEWKDLGEHGIPYDRKRFSTHITLIRKAVFHDSVDRLLRNPPTGSMEVASIALMSSTRGKNGMIYTKVGSVEAD